MAGDGNSTMVRGAELRRLRKQEFNSADAFAAACGSVSVPTIYRAERGGPVLKSYLNRMAGELGVDAERLMAQVGDAPQTVLTGTWHGLFLSTDRFGHPCVVTEIAQLVQDGDAVEGRLVYRENNEAMVDLFENAVFRDNVLCGQLRSEKWAFPLECGAFVVSGGRDLTWLDGYLSWFDLDSEQTQFSKYILIRRDSDSFEADFKNANRLMAEESKLLRTRRFLESGYDFATSLTLVTASEDARAEPATEVPLPPKGHAVVAMASFSVLASEISQTFFAEGLVDDITTDLARLPQVDVLPRGTTGKDHPMTPDEAGRRGATHLLSGSMRRTEDRLWVNCQLVDTTTSRVIWANRYDHAAEAAFALYGVIAGDVGRVLQQTRADITGPAIADTTDPRAYELFLKARSLYLRGMYVHSMRAAEALLLRAIDIDAHFARAHAQLSICRSYIELSIQNSSAASRVNSGFSDAQTALKITPDLPLGNAALGLAHYAAGAYPLAEVALRAAIDKDPSLFEPQFFLARNRRLQGDRSGAAERFALAARLRPDDFRTAGLLAEEHKALGNSEDAEAMFRSALTLVEKELEDHPDNAGALAFGAAVLTHLGFVDRARVWAEWAIAIAPDDCLVHYNVARVHALSGASQTALGHLRRVFVVPEMVQRRFALWMRDDMDFDALAGNAEFNALRQVGAEQV